MQPGVPPPLESMGVEGSGVISLGSKKTAVMEESDVKESIGVLRGKCFCK
jgi:hypothetical protein